MEQNHRSRGMWQERPPDQRASCAQEERTMRNLGGRERGGQPVVRQVVSDNSKTKDQLIRGCHALLGRECTAQL